MFTDIQGYTALMQKDEAKALILRDRHRAVFQSKHLEFEGEILQYYGDGTLSIFKSSVQAVRCGIAIQRELKKEPKVPLRIGIHVGDIIKTNEEVIGDGVNLASRIENLAIPGSVLLSLEVQHQLLNHGIKAVSLGKFQLKNVRAPVEIFAVDEEGLNVPTQKQMAQKRPITRILRLSILAAVPIILLAYFFVVKPLDIRSNLNPNSVQLIEEEIFDRSVAVLPFINLSDEPEQESFSEGIMDEILNHLYRIGGLRIPSRTSSMRYKGETDKTIQEMGNELGVSHVLEGSVSKSKNKVRIIVKLINVQTDDHVWSQDFEEELKDVFAIQSDIAQQVALELKTHISPEVKQRIEKIPTENSEAYNLFLQARYNIRQVMNREKAKTLLDEAIAADQEFAEAYALLGYYWLLRGSWVGDLEPKELLEKAMPLLNKARKINPEYPDTYVYLSLVQLWYQWDFQEASKNWETFFQLSPSNHSMISSYSDFLNASGRSAEAAELIDQAIAHDPSYFNWGSGLSFYFNGQPEKGIQHYETALNLFPNAGLKNGLARLYIYSQKYEAAIQLLEPYIAMGNHFPRPQGNLAIAYSHTNRQSKTDSLLSVLKQRSKSTSVGSPAFYVGMIYAQMGEIDLAFEWLEKAYRKHEVEIHWLKVEPPFEPFRNDPRWQRMLDKVGFP
jgi:TolB-like protein